VIRSFADKLTAAVFDGHRVRAVAPHLQDVARRKLKAIDAAKVIDDLRVPPGNRLERLSGERKGQWSIRINDQWGLCFRWEGVDAHDVNHGISLGERNMAIRRDELRKTDFSGVAIGKRLAPVHPGDVLLSDFIKPMGISRYRVAKNIHVPQRRIDLICRGDAAVSADMALRLGRFFGTTPEFWINLQAQYDLEVAARATGKEIARAVVPLAA